jgi:hypothetical protein
MSNTKNKTMGKVKLFGDYIEKTFVSNPLKYIVLIFIIFFFSLTIYFIPGGDEYTWTDADGVKHTKIYNKGSSAQTLKNQGSYYASIALFLILSCFYIFKFVASEYKRIVFIGSGIIASLITFYYVFKKSGLYETKYIENSFYVLLILIPIVLFYRSIKRHITNLDGWTGFILNFILYIPCLVDDFMEYMKGQFAITSNITYILLGIQVLLITGYMVLPSLLSSPLKGSAFPIMNEANFLDSRKGLVDERQIDFTVIKDVYGHNPHNPDLDKDLVKKKAFESGKNTFTLSMWVYLNQQDTNISESCDLKVFSYDDHPTINYAGVENGKNKLNLKLNGDSNSFEVNIESQKWNNIVFNYNGNTVDIFINGDLVKTHTDTNGLDIKETDVFKYGNDKELDGAICNIKYYKKPLTKYQIVNIYNLLNGQNPPINNIM